MILAIGALVGFISVVEEVDSYSAKILKLLGIETAK